MRIGNMKKAKNLPPSYIYAGRRMVYNGEEIPASPLGNPFTLKQYYGETALRFFRKWLWAQIKAKNPSIMALFNEIKEDSTIVCWCCEKEGSQIFTDPEICHVQVIWKAWRFLKASGQLNGTADEVHQEQATCESPTS